MEHEETEKVTETESETAQEPDTETETETETAVLACPTNVYVNASTTTNSTPLRPKRENPPTYS